MRPILALGCVAWMLLSQGCGATGGTFNVLDAYSAHGPTPRMITPEGYIDHLRRTRYPGGELDNLPPSAVVLHDARVVEFLKDLGYESSDYRVLPIGQTDPTVLYVVSAKNGSAPFILTGGLPGAGGIATQAAELRALGARWVVHIGTAGILGPAIGADTLVLSAGSYKDGGSFLLSPEKRREIDQVAYPDSALSHALSEALSAADVPFVGRTGFTVPVFYFQPSGLIVQLLTDPRIPSSRRPAYMEMEQASLFQTARLMGFAAAGMVAGTDRYVLRDGRPEHAFVDYDHDALKLQALRAAVRAFTRLAAQ